MSLLNTQLWMMYLCSIADDGKVEKLFTTGLKQTEIQELLESNIIESCS